MKNAFINLINLRRRWLRLSWLIALFAIALLMVSHFPGWAESAKQIATSPFQLYEKGQYEQARQSWQYAADAAAQRGDRTTEISNRINEAQALKSLGSYIRAERVLRTALDILKIKEPTQQTEKINLLILEVKLLRSLGEVYQAKGELANARTTLNQSLALAQQLGDRGEISATYFSLGMTERSAVLRESSRLLATSVALAEKAQAEQINTVLKLLSSEPVNVPASAEQPIQVSWFAVTDAFQNAIQFSENPTTLVQAKLNQLSSLADLLPRLDRYILGFLNTTSSEVLENNPDYFIRNFLADAALVKDLSPLQAIFRQVRQIENRSEPPSRPAIADLASVLSQTRQFTDIFVQGMNQLSGQLALLPETIETAQIRIHYAQTLSRLKPIADEADRVDNQLRQQLRSLLGNSQTFYKTATYKAKLPPERTIVRPFQILNQEFKQPKRSLFLTQTTRLNLQQLTKESLQRSAQTLVPAIEIAQKFGNNRVEASANVLLANVYSLSSFDRWKDVETLAQRTMRLVRVEDAPDLMLRAQQQYARSLIQQSRTKPAQAACRVATTTLQANRQNLVAIDQDVQYSFLESVDPFYRECVTTLLPKNAETPDQESLKDARNLIEALQLAELDNFFREACIEGRRAAIDNLVDDQKTAKTAVIYPILLSKRQIGVIVKLPNIKELKYYSTSILNQDAELLLSQFNRQVSEETISDLPQTIENGKIIYSWLIQPFQTELQASNVDTLVFVPDAVFRNVPMAALYNGQTNRYLIDEFAIAISPGLQLTQPSLGKIALKALGAGLTTKAQNSPLRPFSEDVINREFQFMENAKILSRKLVGKEFTSAELVKYLEQNPFNIVHLSTHAAFSSQKEETFVLMVNGEVNVDQFSAILQKRAQQQEGAIDLLILSACDTVKGDNRAALGLSGVAIKSGARSTLATFWTVQDKQTATFIDAFYQAYVDKATRTPKQTKAKALQTAQLALKKDNKPYIWASYVLVGNWL